MFHAHVGTYDVLKSTLHENSRTAMSTVSLDGTETFQYTPKYFQLNFKNKVKNDLKTTFVHKFEHFYAQTMKQNHIQPNFPHPSF